MIGFIILFVVSAPIAVILLSSVKFSLEISDKVCFTVSYLGIELFSFDSSAEKSKPPEKKKQKKSRPKKEKPKKEKERDFKTLLKDYADSKDSKLEIVFDLFEILELLCIKFMKLLGHIRFKNVKMELVVATDDAAETAISYGRACAAVGAIVNYLDKAIHFSPKQISVVSDFTGTEYRFYLNGVIKLRVFFLLKFAVSTLFSLIKLKIGDIKNVTAKQH